MIDIDVDSMMERYMKNSSLRDSSCKCKKIDETYVRKAVPEEWYSKITAEMIDEYWPSRYISDYFAEVLNGTTSLDDMRDNLLSFIPEYEDNKFEERNARHMTNERTTTMDNKQQAAQEICKKIVEYANGKDALAAQSKKFGFLVGLDGARYEGIFVKADTKLYTPTSRPEDYEGDAEMHEDVEVEEMLFLCKDIKISNGTVIFECIDALDVGKERCMTFGQVASIVASIGIDAVRNAAISITYDDRIEFSTIASCDPCSFYDEPFTKGQKMLVLQVIELDNMLDLSNTPTINKLAKEQYDASIEYSRDIKALGKRFYEDDEMLEDDGGGVAGAAGGDGAAAGDGIGSSSADADAGDVAAEMAGTTTADVLGKYEPGKGFMGKDNFYIPAQAKVPMHHWEIANGGSKRKKKNKKYDYEKGMKVVVKMFEDDDEMKMLNEWDAWPPEKLRGKTWDEVKAEAAEKSKEKGKEVALPPYERWEAAQLDVPDEAAHGPLGGCVIDEDKYKRDYLKVYFIHGFYEDGTMFELGPMKRKVAAEYLNLHKLSMNSRAYQQMASSNFSGIRFIGKNDGSNVNVVKLKDGYWLMATSSAFKVGPFSNKQLARMYALAQRYELVKGKSEDKVEEGKRLEYPTYSFSYTMAGVPCMDIVVAEDLSRAMKLFDFQWRVFDNTRPVKQQFNTIDDLQRDLSLLRIKDIEVEELDAGNVDEYMEIADATGNPSTIPQLKARCRNPRFRYILGRNGKTGRSLVTIKW